MQITEDIFEIVAAEAELNIFNDKKSVEERAMIRTILEFSHIIISELPEEFNEVFQEFIELERAQMN